ncbi:MAG: hypothetical protein CVV28_03995 [Methanobacteriales archaeon HGW-Methanobacteriales-1]|jgi:hypothetical protein|nr:MAG: hypothetical protein CVV28_03995 [Methanobacteriales archaeon HGW-Methanobacteriales-1]
MKNLAEKRKEILRKINFNEPLKKQFFLELSKTSNPFPWFEDLINEGYFDPENYPTAQEVPEKEGFYRMPFWEPLGYLENVAKVNYQNFDKDITKSLVKVIDDFINYDAGERNFRTDYAFFNIIFLLPKNEIKMEYIDLVEKNLKSNWNSTLIQSELSKDPIMKLIDYKRKDLLLRLLGIILDFKKESNKYSDEFVSIMDEFWLEKILKNHKLGIAEFCALEAYYVAEDKMLEILNEDEYQFLISAIEDNPQTIYQGDYDDQMVYFVRDMIEYSYSDEIKDIVKNLINSKFSIFRKIAIHTINHYYDELNDLFWKGNGNPLNDYPLKYELYHLFEANYRKFDKDTEKVNLIVDWINNKDYILKLENEEEIACEKLKWLYALKKSKNKEIKSLIGGYEKICTEKIHHPDSDIWIEGPIEIGPKKSDMLCKKSNQELADYLNDSDTLQSVFDKSEIEESFIKCVSDNPEKFATDIDHFLNVSRKNQYHLIYGLVNALRSERIFKSQEIFGFIKKIVDDVNFWTEDYTNKNNYKNWIVSAIAEFIETGTQDDKYAFENDLLPEAEKILLILLRNTKAELQDMHDLVTSVLNSTFGKIYSAMIVYSLKSFRETKRFPDSIKSELEKCLENPSRELSVTLGRFLPNLCVLDKDWTKNNIELMFPKEKESWKPAFTGYLFYSSVIYTNIYNMFKEGGHYDKAIKTEFEDRQVIQRLIQHVCTFYLNGEEKLDDPDSLISKLIDNENPQQISFIINFILAKRNSIDVIQVKLLWERIFNTFTDNQEILNCEIIAKLYRWIELVEEIDGDVLNWLIAAADCMESDTSMSIFIKNLADHVEKSPKEVAEIYLKLLPKTPEYMPEDIIMIVDTLFQKEEIKIANHICNEYRIKGFDFLMETHEKNNPSNQ